MSSQTPPPGYYSGPGGSSQVPNSGFNPWKIADPNNITGVGNKGAAPPTDFGQAAAAQGAASQQATAQQTQANRPNQQTDFGSTQWSQDANGNWTQQSSLAPGLQGLQNSFTQQLANNSGDATRDAAINAAYGQATSRLNPQWAQQGEQMQAQLANQGLDPNSQAYRTASQQFGQQKNDAYSSAMNNAIGMGTQYGLQQQAQNASQGIQGLNALHGFLNMPSFGAAGQAQAAPYMSAAEAAAGMLDKTNAQNSQNGADAAGGAMSMVGSIFSDERLKEDVQRLSAEAEPGIPLASFRFKGGTQRHVGVIAQDVEKVRPDAVHTDAATGFKKVDYSKLRLFRGR